jgi:MFS family permease|eukprot:COSAG01_NODE_6563_length_3608_cov_3.327159_1_plen_502_part_00
MFVAYVSAQTLASTLPIPPPASGTVAISLVYWFFTFSSLWSPLLVHHVGAKPCVVGSFVMYGTFIAANMYPRWWTLYPGAAMVGLAASPLWVSQGILITHFAQMYARARGEDDVSAHVGLFNGIFQSFLVLTGVAGNVLSSVVFDTDGGGGGGGTGSSHSGVLSAAAATTQSTTVPQSTVFLLFAVYLGSVGCAILCALGTLPSTATVEAERRLHGLAVAGSEKMPTIWTTLQILRQPRMLLLLPTFAAMGWLYAFVSANFTKDVIEPALGERSVGYVMAVFYVACAVVSISVGRISDVVGRPVVIGFSALCVGVTVGYLRWMPPPTGALAIYALAVTIGVGMQSLRTPLAAQMSANYRDDIEAAFACTEMVTSVVGALGYLSAATMSEEHRLDIAALLCLLGFSCYYLEDWYRCSSNVSLGTPSTVAAEGVADTATGQQQARHRTAPPPPSSTSQPLLGHDEAMLLTSVTVRRQRRLPPLGARLCDQLLHGWITNDEPVG